MILHAHHGGATDAAHKFCKLLDNVFLSCAKRKGHLPATAVWLVPPSPHGVIDIRELLDAFGVCCGRHDTVSGTAACFALGSFMLSGFGLFGSVLIGSYIRLESHPKCWNNTRYTPIKACVCSHIRLHIILMFVCVCMYFKSKSSQHPAVWLGGRMFARSAWALYREMHSLVFVSWRVRKHGLYDAGACANYNKHCVI